MKYIIGDTIRLRATIKNLSGVEEAPVSISVKIYTPDGTEIHGDASPNLTPETTAQYYSDWEINTVTSATRLTVIWEWTTPDSHQKKMLFSVAPIM